MRIYQVGITGASAFCLGLFVLSIPAARADDLQDAFLLRNIGDLVTLCTVPPDNAQYATASAFCQGFAVGTYRAAIEVDLGVASRRGANGRKVFCPPGDNTPSRTQAVGEFVTWARSHQEGMAMSATDGVVRFMAERFACPVGVSATTRAPARR